MCGYPVFFILVHLPWQPENPQHQFNCLVDSGSGSLPSLEFQQYAQGYVETEVAPNKPSQEKTGSILAKKLPFKCT